ncbi:MAG: ATP-binding protein [Anaerolineae bacterium]
MKQLAVLSGKGGTGKTTVTAGLAHLATAEHRLVLADADVDAANLELVLDAKQESEHPFRSGELAVIDPEACEACGRCAEVCRFDAIVAPSSAASSVTGSDPATSSYRVDSVACEGCASCYYACPFDAISMVPRLAGQWFVSETWLGPLYHAQLRAGEENSGKLVTLIKQMARLRAKDDGADLVIVDGPPGIGCPVISTLAGADLTLIVTEPTVAGVHDLERILQTAAHFRVPAAVLLNKADLSSNQANAITTYCERHEVPLVGRLPFDTAVTETMVRGKPITTVESAVTDALREAWAALSPYVTTQDT